MDDNSTGSHSTGVESPLLSNYVDGVVDYRGRPVLRSKSGGWRSAYFIISVEVAERFAYYGISSNLITYLTGPLGQSTSTAAQNVNVWSGIAKLLPLFGAFIADAFLGQYLTIITASLLYVLALASLSLSTLLPSNCETGNGSSSCSSQLQVIVFFISLYLVAFAQGGHKPCVQAFGADQFDSNNPQERNAINSFFNWWYFGLSVVGPIVGIFVVSYIQDNFSWGLGFGIPCIFLVLSLIIFLFGTVTYRFGEKIQKKSAFRRIGHVFVQAAKNWQTTPSKIYFDAEASPHQQSQQFRFLNKALYNASINEDGNVCSIDDVEEAKGILRLAPIWVSCLGYAIVFAQTSTFFTKQGATMDRSIGNFKIPAATLQSFIGISVITLIPIYDTVFVPLTRSITRKSSGITMLQRMGIGIFISIISMVVAAVIETKRLKTAREYGLVDDPKAIIPMKIWWLLPQYLLVGAGDVFTMVGMQQFFYDQVSNDLKSMGLALYLSIMGIGSFLSSFLISIVMNMTGGDGEDGWISDNMNQGHVDYFYYLLAGISLGAFVMFMYSAKSYVYNRGGGLKLPN